MIEEEKEDEKKSIFIIIIIIIVIVIVERTNHSLQCIKVEFFFYFRFDLVSGTHTWSEREKIKKYQSVVTMIFNMMKKYGAHNCVLKHDQITVWNKDEQDSGKQSKE